MTDEAGIWDWATRLSEQTQRADKMRKIRARIAETGRRCGDCCNWAKSRQCPREHSVNGYSHGPSCDDRICATNFTETAAATERRVSLTAELATLTEPPR